MVSQCATQLSGDLVTLPKSGGKPSGKLGMYTGKEYLDKPRRRPRGLDSWPPNEGRREPSGFRNSARMIARLYEA